MIHTPTLRVVFPTCDSLGAQARSPVTLIYYHCFDASQDAPMREGQGVDRPDGLTPPSVLSFTDMVEKTRYQTDGTKSRYGA